MDDTDVVYLGNDGLTIMVIFLGDFSEDRRDIELVKCQDKAWALNLVTWLNAQAKKQHEQPQEPDYTSAW